MGQSHEYVSPWADMKPADPVERRRADAAFGRLIMHFLAEPHQLAKNPDEYHAVTRKFHTVLGGYVKFSTQVASEGIPEAERGVFIRDHMVQEGLLGGSDSARNAEEFAIISEGYELNRPYFDRLLGTFRRLRYDLQVMLGDVEGTY